MSAVPDLKIVEPPMIDQAEEALVGSFLNLPHLMASYPLESSDFVLFKNKPVYEAMRSLAQRNETITELTVKNELDITGNLKKIGDPNYLMLLSTRAYEYSAGHSISETVETLYRIVKERAKQRRGIELHTMAANTLKNGKYDEHARIVAQIVELAQPKQPASPTIKLLTWDDLKDTPPVSYLDANHYLVRGGFNVVYARRGSGKSFFAAGLSLTIAQTDPVVYILGEGKGGFPDRMAAWMNHNKKDAGKFYLIDHAINMLREEAVTALIAAIKELNPALVVLDTLARCFAGGDENNTADMTRFVESCDRIRRETGAAILVLHHTGKQANGSRGSIVLEDAADVVISLVADNNKIKLSCAKTRDDEAFEARSFQLMRLAARPGNNSCVLMDSADIVRTSDDRLTDQEAQILETMALAPFEITGITYARLQRDTGIPQSSLNRRLAELEFIGYVRHGQPREPYFITALGKHKITKQPLQPVTTTEQPSPPVVEQPTTTTPLIGVVGGGNPGGNGHKAEFGILQADLDAIEKWEKRRAKHGK